MDNKERQEDSNSDSKLGSSNRKSRYDGGTDGAREGVIFQDDGNNHNNLRLTHNQKKSSNNLQDNLLLQPS